MLIPASTDRFEMKYLLLLALLPACAFARAYPPPAADNASEIVLPAVEAAPEEPNADPKPDSVPEYQPVEPDDSEPVETPVVEASAEPAPAPETPVVETPAVETPVETPDESPEIATEAPTESPVDETEAPTEDAPVDTTTVVPTEPVQSETEAPATNNDDSSSDSTSFESDESPAETADENKKESETAPAAEAESVPAATDEPAAPAAVPGKSVVATPTQTGASAIVDGVTVRFALQATWVVDGGARRRGYVVKITNGSEQEVCGVTFSNNAEATDIWNLLVNANGSFSTKDLRLVPGANANQFGYVSAARSRPTILSVTHC